MDESVKKYIVSTIDEIIAANRKGSRLSNGITEKTGIRLCEFMSCSELHATANSSKLLLEAFTPDKIITSMDKKRDYFMHKRVKIFWLVPKEERIKELECQNGKKKTKT